MKAWFLLPLLLFVALFAFLLFGLNRDPHEIPSPLLDKAAPAFLLPQLEQPQRSFAPATLRGKVWILNVWASWCEACREEHTTLVDFARSKTVPLVGLDYKDERADAMDVLRQHGNPYDITAFDADGRVGIDYGVYGVPESYVIDQQGIIRLKYIGPITPEVLAQTIMPLLNKLKPS